MAADGGPSTLFDKIWREHVVLEREDGQALLYVDSHFLQDGSAPAFEMLRQRGLKPRAPGRAFATPDHYVPTSGRDLALIADPEKRAMAQALESDAAAAGIAFFGLDDPRQGIVHVVAPEQGMSRPGMLIVCGDSHTSTHGALGALAFGIGSSEVAHVLATQTLWQRKPRTLRITIDGRLGPGATAKDLILAVIAKISAAGATGCAVEYAGEAVEALSIEGRMTLCNMTIEAGGRAGMVAPDETTFAYLKGRPFAPEGAAWERAVAAWRGLKSDPGAVFDRELRIDASAVEPMVTWGNSPEDALAITGAVPDPASAPTPERREAMERALAYMGLQPGQPLTGIAVDRVFIGSCTNGRIEDLQSAAAVVRGRKVAPGVEAWVTPGSGPVKAAAEAQRGSTGCSGMPASSGASPAARCAWAPTATRSRPASAAPPPATATSSAARGAKRAPT